VLANSSVSPTIRQAMMLITVRTKGCLSYSYSRNKGNCELLAEFKALDLKLIIIYTKARMQTLVYW
jgi:hypothetical protein